MARFIVGAAAFAKALAQVTPAVVNNPVVPILENVRLESRCTATGYELLLTCSDLETTLQTALNIEAIEEWQLCVPAKKLLDTLRALPDQPVTCTVDANSYGFELSASRCRYKLAGENAVDFPRRPVVKAQPIAVAANALRAGLLATLPTVHTDFSTASRMCGIHFETKAGKLTTLVATDGHRVHQYNILREMPDGGFTVPTKAASLLLAILETSGEEAVQLLTDGSSIALADGRWDARLIDERFPDYRNVLPISHPFSAVVDRDELVAALRRLDRYSNSQYRAARFEFGANALHLSARDIDFASDGSEEITCTYDGDPFAIGFNCPFAQTQLRTLPAGPVRLGMSAPSRAWIATSDTEGSQPKLVTLLMPVSLDVVNA